MIELLNTDCMEFMAGLPDKHYDLCIVDPPYGIGAGKHHLIPTGGAAVAPKGKYKASEWDARPPEQDYFHELLRVSRNQIVWGANHFISRIPFDSPSWIVWDKMNGDNNFADCELAWTSFRGSVRQFQFRWQGMLQGNMAAKEERIHPTQKPVALYRWLLKNYAKPGQRILDTHGGSMSIAIACDIEGYNLTLCEIDRDYFEAGSKRLKDHQSAPRLFAPEPVAPARQTSIEDAH